MVSEGSFIADRESLFSLTVPCRRAQELEPLREAAEVPTNTVPGVEGAIGGADGDQQGSLAQTPRRRPAPTACQRTVTLRPNRLSHKASPKTDVPFGNSPRSLPLPRQGRVGKSTHRVNLALGLSGPPV